MVLASCFTTIFPWFLHRPMAKIMIHHWTTNYQTTIESSGQIIIIHLKLAAILGSFPKKPYDSLSFRKPWNSAEPRRRVVPSPQTRCVLRVWPGATAKLVWGEGRRLCSPQKNGGVNKFQRCEIMGIDMEIFMILTVINGISHYLEKVKDSKSSCLSSVSYGFHNYVK